MYFLDTSLYNFSENKVIKDMINGYKSQDEERDYDQDEYIDADWIKKQFEKSSTCKGCGCTMTYEVGSKDKISVDRINNEFTHTKDDSQLCCVKCYILKK